MSTETVTGYVQWVKFDPSRRWFTTLTVAERPDSPEAADYQIDGAAFFVEGGPVDRADLLKWLARTGEHMPVHVKLTGNFGAYKTCEMASFKRDGGP
jgi:hypothetical protein